MALRKSPQGRSGRRDGLAVAGSVGAHLLVLWLILGSASGDLVPSGDNVGNGADGGGGDPLMTVSLVDPPPQMSPPAQDASAAASAAVEDLFKRLVVATSPQAEVFVSPPQKTEKTSLDEVLGKAKGGGSQAGETQAQAQQTAGQRNSADSPQAGPARTGATASSGSLFGMIEPCWRKQPGVSRVLVKLELTLSSDGRLALPPKIIRTSQMVLDDQQFFAEARALNALKACLPLRTGAPTGVQQVEFRPDAISRR